MEMAYEMSTVCAMWLLSGSSCEQTAVKDVFEIILGKWTQTRNWILRNS